MYRFHFSITSGQALGVFPFRLSCCPHVCVWTDVFISWVDTYEWNCGAILDFSPVSLTPKLKLTTYPLLPLFLSP